MRATEDGRLLDEQRGFKGQLLSLAFCPAGRLAVSGGTDGHLRVWGVGE